MKVLTVKQPWGSLIVEPDPNNIGFGIKPIENRTWPCPKKYIGQRVLIHAGKGKQYSIHQLLSIDQKRAFEKAVGYEYDFNKMFPKGAIIGSVEIVDCVINHPNIWAEKMGNMWVGKKCIYNWVLANPIKFPEPIPAKGKLGFWEYPNIIAEPEEKDGALFCHCQIPVKEENQVMSLGDGHYCCRYCGGKWYK